eukprot:1852249-Amphidinium_carterae.1
MHGSASPTLTCTSRNSRRCFNIYGQQTPEDQEEVLSEFVAFLRSFAGFIGVPSVIEAEDYYSDAL